jgi:hypothetical protein
MDPLALLVGLAILVVLAIPFAISLRRSNELFRARVRAGKLELLRGRMPQALFDDLDDVFAGTDLNAELRVVRERGRPQTELKGLEGATAQRVRNVIGRFKAAEIRAGRRGSNRASRRAGR